MIFPEFLQQGDLITIVSPSGAIDGEVLEQAATAIRRLGYSVKIAEHAKGKHHRFSATDEERLADLQSALDDPHTRVILCGRGGYGLTRIVDRLDFSKFIENPKFVVGFSDITALHAALLTKAKCCSVHGQMAKAFVGYDATLDKKDAENPEVAESVEELLNILTGVRRRQTYFSYNQRSRVARDKVKGRLFGGNLSLIYALRGTDLDITKQSGILYIEDIGERMYSIDRMMQNLRMSGVFGRIKGLIVGKFTDTDIDSSFGSIEDLIFNVTKGYDFPILFDIPFGHVDRNLPIINGSVATIAANALTFKTKK